MTLTLPENLKSQLNEAARYCSLPPEKLASLFVEDGIKLYRDDRDEFRDTLNGEDQQSA